MTEFVAAALLLPMLALTVRPLKSNPNSNDTPPPPALFWLAAFLGIAASAIRVQYAMLAFVFLLIMFLRADRKGRIHLAASSVMFFFAVGLFDYLTWGDGFILMRLMFSPICSWGNFGRAKRRLINSFCG